MRTYLYSLLSKFLTFVGDIKFFGWKRPLWFVIDVQGYRLKGQHYREVAKIIEPGDVLLSRSEQYLTTFLIPGYWTHAGLFYGGEKERVIHAVSEGVIIEDIINFMRTDEMVVLRPHEDHVKRALALAKSMVDMKYDFIFDFTDKNRVSCTELVYCCYPRLIKPRERMGKMMVIADDIFFDKEGFTVIWDSRKHKS